MPAIIINRVFGKVLNSVDLKAAFLEKRALFNIYFYLFIWLCQVLVASCEIFDFHCSMSESNLGSLQWELGLATGPQGKSQNMPFLQPCPEKERSHHIPTINCVLGTRSVSDLIWFLSLSSKPSFLHMRNLRLREVKWLPQVTQLERVRHQ